MNSFEAKKQRFFREVSAQPLSVKFCIGAAPLDKLLWKLGIKSTPFPLRSPWRNTLVMVLSVYGAICLYFSLAYGGNLITDFSGQTSFEMLVIMLAIGYPLMRLYHWYVLKKRKFTPWNIPIEKSMKG